MKENIEQVPIEQIRESKSNPRKTFNQADEIELIRSIGGSSIVTPLILRRVSDGQCEIVDGARRFRAAKALDVIDVPAIVRSYTDEQAYEVQLISFAQRVDIHPLDEAAAYEQLRKKKFDIPQIAAKVGKERSYIARRLQLVNLVESGVKMMREDKLPLPHALEVARLGAEQQKQALEGNFRYHTPSLKELRDDIQRDILLNLDSAQFKKDDAKLAPKAGPCTICPKRTGANQDLFGDISKKGNHCLDSRCFHLKIQAFNDRRKEELEAKGTKVVEISDSYYPGSKKVLGTEAYNVVPASKANAYGLYIDGRQENVIVPIVIKGEKQKEGSGPRPAANKLSKDEAEKRYKRRLEIFGNRIEQEARLRQFKALLLRLKWPIERKDFEIILEQLIDRSEFNAELVSESVGVKSHIPWPAEATMYGKLSSLTDQQVVQLAFGITACQELVKEPTFGPPEDDRLEALCHRHGVDRKKIREDVAKEMEAKKPKPPKIDEPKAKPKAKKAAKKKSKK